MSEVFLAKSIVGVAMCFAIAVAVAKTKSPWCLLGLYFVCLMFSLSLE